MGTGFTVSVGEVRSHASTVATIAVRVRAASNGAQDSVGGAYGQLGEFFAAALTDACGELRDTIGRASETVHQVETGLRQAADLYQHNDDQHASLYALGGEADR